MNTVTINGQKWSQTSDVFGARAESEGWGFRLSLSTIAGVDDRPFGWSITDLRTGEEVASGDADSAREAAKAATTAAQVAAR